MLDKLKKKWGIKSNLQAILIMVVFSLAGSSIVWVRRLVFPLMGIHESTPFWIKFFAWLAVFFPTYQIMLLVFGFLLGQFHFFWEKKKKMVQGGCS